MRTAAIALGALGLTALTAGCVQDTQYPSYSSGYGSGYPSYAYNTGYSAYPTYGSGYYPTASYGTYGPSYAVSTYPYQTAPQPRSQRYWNSARRDADRDGIPNRYDRDANGDGIPDRWQGRRR